MNRLSSSTVELTFALFVYFKCAHMSTYTAFALFATRMTIKLKYSFCQSPFYHVYNIQPRTINKHLICSHIKQHLSNNKSDNMGNNYEVYFSIKLTGNQFGQKKNQGLFFNHLEGKKSI